MSDEPVDEIEDEPITFPSLTPASGEPIDVEPGAHFNIAYDEYVRWKGVNYSLLDVLRTKTPAHLKYRIEHGEKPRTKALDLGWTVHLAALEPERFQRSYAVAPNRAKRSNADKEFWRGFEAENRGKVILKREELDNISEIVTSIYSHETAAQLIGGEGFSEVSLSWVESTTGELAKARLDRIGQMGSEGVIADLKTTQSARREDFERSIWNYGYHGQAAHYLDGINTVMPLEEGMPARKFMFIAVETDPPYCVAVYELDDVALAFGGRERLRYLRTYAECRKAGRWPGWGDGADYASIPPWALKRFSSEE